MPASLSHGELENHDTRTGCEATRGNVLYPDQFSGFGGHRIKAAYELAFMPLKAHCHLGYGWSSTQLVGYNTVVIVDLAGGAVCIRRVFPDVC